MQLNEAIDEVDKYEIIRILINRYSEELDNYQLDTIILDMIKIGNKDIDYLCEKFEIFVADIYEILINFIVEELGFTETVNNLLEHNYKDKYDNYKEYSAWYNSILSGAICKDTYTLKRKTFPASLFSNVKFNSDVILDVEIVPTWGFSAAEFDNSKLIIKSGCKEIKENAFDMTNCDDLYLPSSLTSFEYSNPMMITNIHYDGTKSEFIKLLDTSEWWDEVDSVGSDVYCVDDRIRWNEVII